MNKSDPRNPTPDDIGFYTWLAGRRADQALPKRSVSMGRTPPLQVCGGVVRTLVGLKNVLNVFYTFAESTFLLRLRPLAHALSQGLMGGPKGQRFIYVC